MRKLTLIAAALAVAIALVLWVLTIPAIVPAAYFRPPFRSDVTFEN